MEQIGKGMISTCFYCSKSNTVIKQYNKDYFKNNHCAIVQHFKNDVATLKKFSGTLHFPTLISVNDNEKTIVMSYCGPRLIKENLPSNWKEQCKEMEQSFKQANLFHNDVFCKNMAVFNNIISIFDFGMTVSTPNQYNGIELIIQRELINGEPKNE